MIFPEPFYYTTTPQPATDRMSTMEADIKEIKEAIKNMTAKPKTWTDVVANTDAINVHVEMAKRERLEKAKQEHSKTEITLSFQDASSAMKKKIV